MKTGYFEWRKDNKKIRLIFYSLIIKKKKFTKGQLSDVSSALTGATAKKMIEWGIIYGFAT